MCRAPPRARCRRLRRGPAPRRAPCDHLSSANGRKTDSGSTFSGNGGIGYFVVVSDTDARMRATLPCESDGATQRCREEIIMVKVALLARLVSKPGKEEEVAAFLKGALPLAEAEHSTTVWFAIRLSKNEFGVFDAFPDDGGRKAHLAGPIAKALMAKAD